MEGVTLGVAEGDPVYDPGCALEHLVGPPEGLPGASPSFMAKLGSLFPHPPSFCAQGCSPDSGCSGLRGPTPHFPSGKEGVGLKPSFGGPKWDDLCS